MRGTLKTHLTATWLLLPLAAAVPQSSAVAAPTPTAKSVKECNAELQRNEAALEAAGESASAFFHECWFHSTKGSPTPIQAAAKVDSAKPAKNKDEASTASAEPSARHQTRTRHVAQRRAYLATEETPRFRRREERESYLPAAAPAVVAQPALPTQVNVNVPDVGSVSVPILPVPGLAMTVRNVVDHPLVPGLVIPGIITATP